MKRMLLMLIVTTFVLAGCTGSSALEKPIGSSDHTAETDIPLDDAADFGFSYTVVNDDTILERGKRVEISVELTNQQSVSYTWKGSYNAFRAGVVFVYTDGDDTFRISPEPSADTDDIGEYAVLPGESRSFSYYFSIPADAPLGNYSIICSFGGTEKVFKDAFTLVA